MNMQMVTEWDKKIEYFYKEGAYVIDYVSYLWELIGIEDK